ncbi:MULTISPECIES: DUF2945 domain-containing protein [unclassified Rathayibacter]|uniref:DUF2945 domain-containing protein n=1 Tax=unclassified Rathayibacter TaxID=2609250 RepID=UPI00188A8C91|nr:MULTISPECIES: DUF2945 domain-containing protein [unclassified Rathayibacter]MBF4461352.1 DUF2945 domain-containing protein [Rathayibacter sp. VKM Ac-2879]MBF4502763.1 DUF2945 domain-containing protein [Rathayibacter sp. VKM Ac-2878]
MLCVAARAATSNAGARERKHLVKKGDAVSWNTSQGETHGELIENKTKEFRFDGQKSTASDDEPYRIVQSEKTGARAAHKESSLTTR